MPANLSVTYCTEEDIQAYLSVEGEAGRLDDDTSGSFSGIEVVYLTKAINWATERVNFYLEGLYTRQDLSESWLVNQWAVIIACYWLALRRGNPSPASLHDLYKEAIEDLKLVKTGEYQIPGAGYRNAAWPAWSNVRVSALHDLRRIRVETPISEDTPLPGRRNRDVAAPYIIEPG